MTHAPAHEPLLPCPFCGSSSLEINHRLEIPDFFVLCTGCGAIGLRGSRAEAIEGWNIRATPTADPQFEAQRVEAQRSQLRQMLFDAGGRFHGPRVEHLSMEEQAFWRFMDAVIAKFCDLSTPLIALTHEMAAALREQLEEHRATWLAARADVEGIELATALFEKEMGTIRTKQALAKYEAATKGNGE